MPRDPELEKLLRSTEQLVGGESNEPVAQPTEQATEKPKSESGSSFMKSVVGLFIVQDEEPKNEAVDTPPPTPNSVEQIAETVPAPTFTVSSDDMSSKDFQSIYAEAGINESSFTVDKLAALLADPNLKDQPLSTKTLVLKMALKAQNIEPTVPVTDAVKRDKSLDAYQKMLNDRAKSTEATNSQKIQQIQEEVNKMLAELNAEMDKLRAETSEMKRQAESFAARRQEEERRLAELIIPLLEGQPNPVNVGNNVD
jgi:hypothetical protein